MAKVRKVLIVFGTRPEAIKLAPLVKVFQSDATFDVRVCISAQHRQMLDQVMDFFQIKADYDLDLMKPNQTLFSLTSGVLNAMEQVLVDFQPDVVFVQGDTTTVFAAALAAFYKKIKVAHVEAGLRSGQKYSPFPEEMNRILAGNLSDIHFSPTQRAVENLLSEGFDSKDIHMVGNTVIDALLLAKQLISEEKTGKYGQSFQFLDATKKTILVTGHRRESFGGPFIEICEAIREIASGYNDVQFVYPVHLNPQVQEPVKRILGELPNVHLIDPLEYPYLIWLMDKSYFVLTDSGGIQEEAPTLGKPVLVMRDVTERQEGVDAGTAKLVGTNKSVLIREMKNLLDDPAAYSKMANAVNPYGDGKSCERIVELTHKFLE